MFINVAQRVDTSNEWTQVRTRYMPESNSSEKILVAFGVINSLSLTIDEAKRLFLELEIALREAYDDEEVTA
jgi:hypothetical protein